MASVSLEAKYETVDGPVWLWQYKIYKYKCYKRKNVVIKNDGGVGQLGSENDPAGI